MHAVKRWSGLALVVGLVACESSGTGPDDTPDPELDRAVATQVGEAAAQNIEIMGSPGGSFAIAAAPGRDRHWPFRCGRIDLRGFRLERTCTFLDTQGNEQAKYDPETTEAALIHYLLDVSIERKRWSAEIESEHDLTVTGLFGDEETRTWNGNGSHASARTRFKKDGEVKREYTFNGAWEIDDVVVPAAVSNDNWPLSGTISASFTATTVGGPHDGTVRTREGTVTFNGTHLVPIVVNGVTYTFDLRSRQIVGDEDDE